MRLFITVVKFQKQADEIFANVFLRGSCSGLAISNTRTGLTTMYALFTSNNNFRKSSVQRKPRGIICSAVKSSMTDKVVIGNQRMNQVMERIINAQFRVLFRDSFAIIDFKRLPTAMYIMKDGIDVNMKPTERPSKNLLMVTSEVYFPISPSSKMNRKTFCCEAFFSSTF